jgi:hypothetical protein
MKNRKQALIWIGNLVALLIILNEVKAQDTRGYIYGKVTTFDNVYQGQIQWNDEEVFWSDHFNAEKTSKNAYRKGLDLDEEEESSSWSDFSWNLSSIWEDKYRSTRHVFTCQFGDIKAMKDLGRTSVTLVLKNKVEIPVEGEGYNDVNTNLVVLDDEIGEVEIRWGRIESIEFLPTPKSLSMIPGNPIYGTVETFRKGTFVGFIQWDQDERLDVEKLDGDNRDGDISIPFREITSIEKRRDGCDVVLRSGRELSLTNSNDVDNNNRGIIMFVPGVGRIEIPWKYFVRADLEPAPNSGPAYAAYTPPRGLRGQVYTIEGDKLEGRIVYDIDESWEIEMLEGNDDEVEYTIAFRDIKAIEPKNYDYSMIKLRSGDQLLLGGGRDVSDRNDGLLVFQEGAQEPEYVPWKKVVEIVFD